MVIRILLCQINLNYFLWLPQGGLHLQYGCYILDNGDLYSQLASDVDQTVQLLFLVY
jgi:hypothetical protein